jgi:hypothetical protein
MVKLISLVILFAGLMIAGYFYNMFTAVLLDLLKSKDLVKWRFLSSGDPNRPQFSRRNVLRIIDYVTSPDDEDDPVVAECKKKLRWTFYSIGFMLFWYIISALLLLPVPKK